MRAVSCYLPLAMLGACGAVLMSAHGVQAAQIPHICTSRPNLVSLLKTRYSEVLHAEFTARDDQSVEVFSSPQGTWSAVKTMANGMACIVAAGKSVSTAPGLVKISGA